FFYCSRPHRLLHSFPTRRSSDLPDHDNVTSSWFLRAMLPALVPALARPVWDEFRDVAVKLGHRLVEAGEPGSAGPRELSQVGVGDLAVADDSLDRDVRVRKIVGPELMPRMGSGPGQDRPCRG